MAVRTVVVASALLSALGAMCGAQPVLITSPQTINPGDGTVIPTAGGAPIPLATAQITVRGTTLTINGRHSIDSLRLEADPSSRKPAVVTHDANFSFDYSGGAQTDVVNGLHLIVTNDVIIDPLSSIDVTAKGFPSTQGPGAGANAPGNGGANCAASGGGHGGAGGAASIATYGSVAGGATYGSATAPTTFGSGGGAACGGGGSGGGAVRIQTPGRVIIDGKINANGMAPPTDGYPGGGGAGGSVWIQAGLLGGRGFVNAAGGNVSYDQFDTFIGPSGPGQRASGAGGGGRVRLEACISMLYTWNAARGENVSIGFSGGFSGRGSTAGFQASGTLSTAVTTSGVVLRSDRHTCAGESVTMTAATSLPVGASVQWLRDGVPLADSSKVSGSSSSALTLTDLQSGDAGLYEPRFTTNCGTFVAPGTRLSVGVPMITRLSSATLPVPLVDASVAYDRKREKIVVVGGWTADSTPSNQTWEFDGTTWTLASIPPFPTQTAAGVLVYDEFREVLVHIGGKGTSGIYEWDGSAAGWVLRQFVPVQYAGTMSSNLAWFNPSAAYDPVRRVTIIHGGFLDYAGRTGPRTDSYGWDFMWEWDGTTLKSISYGLNQAAAPTNAPEGRSGARMVFDRARGQLLLFGGMTDEGSSNDLWSWDGTIWTRLSSEGIESRWLHAMVYDEARERTVVWSGAEGTTRSTGDIREWDGARWSDVLTGSSPLVGGSAAAVVYYPPTRTIYRFGGVFSGGGQSQITTYAPGNAWIKTSPVTFSGCDNGSSQLTINIAPQAGVSYQWYRNGLPVADGPGGAASGGGTVSNASGIAPLSGVVTLQISGANANDLGNYFVLLSTSCGSVSTTPASLTLQSCCPADLNGDQQVDDADFVVFAAAYNILDCTDPSMPVGCPADLNIDGFVDDADFVIFATAYNELLCP
ncbi:MAG: hypothetical protein K2Y21_08995 [Phycisphaerales bacterium]|nr:hypothetical protein [Phycisphaerales bacterium]